MPKPADPLQRVIELSLDIERAEHAVYEAEWRLEDLRKELAEAVAYAAQQQAKPATAETQEPQPWTDDSLSAPDRILAYFTTRPHGQVTARELIEAGIDIKVENMRSTLKRMTDRKQLTRITNGVYALAQLEPGEPTS